MQQNKLSCKNYLKLSYFLTFDRSNFLATSPKGKQVSGQTPPDKCPQDKAPGQVPSRTNAPG